MVGWQTAIASRLTPTVERCTSARNWSAGRRPSRASLAPTVERCTSASDWSAGRSPSWASLAPTVERCTSASDWSAGRPPSRASLAPTVERCTSASDWSAGRPPSRASLAPTVERCTSARNWSAGRPPSRAGSLLQWNDARLQEIGRLSGRLRGQASLLQWNDARLQEIGRLSGRLRGQASLLQGVRCTRFAFHHSLGRALARLLLILICPPLREAEWRRSSGGGRVAPCGEAAHIERRSKRSRPEAMPPDECRSEGTPSPGEGPDAGAKPFAYFSAFGKVSRCKSETASSRYRRNGYVRHQQQHGRLPGRQAQTDSAVS